MTSSTPAQEDGGRNDSRDRPAARCLARRSAAAAIPRSLLSCERSSNSGIRVILTGAGSSAFIGDMASGRASTAPRAPRRGDRDPPASSASPRSLERHVPTLVVSFGRSGNSPESLATTALADELIDDVGIWAHLRCRRCAREGAIPAGRKLRRRLHARACQRHRLRDDLEPDLDAVDGVCGFSVGHRRQR